MIISNDNSDDPYLNLLQTTEKYESFPTVKSKINSALFKQ